jgi:F-type H+-transporting ATPase subunit alpha
MKALDNIFKEIEEEISKTKTDFSEKNIGIVTEVRDEVVFLEGFKDVTYGELITFEGDVKGQVIDLRENSVGAIIFGDYLKIKQGDTATGTGEVFSIAVSDEILGRVVNGLGEPIDGKGKIKADKMYPVERIAPGVVTRKSVDTPLQTGTKAIDALIPIGRGQRELIIGDRGTGKSTVAIDAIINQKGQDVICIYNAIGQKKSKIAAVVELLSKSGAMEYTVVVSTSGSDPASQQYVSPYAATAIGEYFLDKGRDVLIVYDDLTKHAWAWRQVSLILRRPSGREAYPGDIFYTHSRLLERACRLDKEYGGGSITALPIIETQENDVSAYIPTNVISITDGQLFLESDLFNSGIRPAINVGISVSRVGSAAQTKAMKQVAGKLKLDLAQYRELAAFSQFESDLDATTKQFLDRGARMTQLLRQKNNHPLDLAHQVVNLWVGVQGFLDKVPVSEVVTYVDEFLKYVELKDKKIFTEIAKNKIIDKKEEESLKKLVEEFAQTQEKTEKKK